MNIKEKVIVYPFDIEFIPILRNNTLNYKYDIVGLVSPNGWGLTGKDAGFVDSVENIGMKVSNDFESLLDTCDTVIFNESHTPLNFEKIIKPKIDKAIDENKNIICTINIEMDVYKEFVERCSSKGKYFRLHRNIEEEIFNNTFDIEYIHKISTPVIFVMGMSERTNKFDIQLALRKLYIDLGYKVSQIGSRRYCEMLGFHSVPAFMYNSRIDEHKKIVMFNHYVKNIEISEEPDLIIIGIPGGLLPINNQFTNKFGMMAYEISRAITPDAAILSILYDEYTPEFFKELSTMVKYRFATEIDCYNLSNMKFDWNSSTQNDKVSYIMIDSNVIDEEKKKLGMLDLDTLVYNSLSVEDAKEMGEHLINKLASYSEVESI